MLKKVKILESFRGKKGGYMLSKKPEDICIGDIFRAVDGNLILIAGKRPCRVKDIICKFWDEIENSFKKIIDSRTLEDLINKKQEWDKVIDYSI